MGINLNEVDGDPDANEYYLRPYGLLLMALGSEELGHRACDALLAHMEKFKQAVAVSENGLHFEPGLDDEDFAVLRCAILWRDFTDPELKATATRELEEAVDAARRRTWARRRENGGEN